jgi:hypothetical protein
MKNIKFFKENEGKLSEYSTTEEKVFTAEVPTKTKELSMHEYIILNREKIFGRYLWLVYEKGVTEGSIDFVGYDEDGNVYIIEVKRNEISDTRNRGEVVAQIIKYVLDLSALSIKKEDLMKKLVEKIPYKDIPINETAFPEHLIDKIEKNLQNNTVNTFIITENANDQLLSAVLFVSYGSKFHKISVIELKRYYDEKDDYCITRVFNQHNIYTNTRPKEADLETKLETLKNQKLKDMVMRWDDVWSVNPLTVNTPDYVTFQNDRKLSIQTYLYFKDSKGKTWDRKIDACSIVFEITNGQQIEKLFPSDFERWFTDQISRYEVKQPKAQYYCLDMSNYNDEQIEEVFRMMDKIARFQLSQQK